MSEIESARIEFDETREMLKFVNTNEERKAVEERAWEAQRHLYKIDPEFRDFVDARRRDTERRRTESRRDPEARVKEAEIEVNMAKTTGRVFTALASKEMQDKKTTQWVQDHKFKLRDPEELGEKIHDKYVCPICRGNDKGNKVDGLPFCFNCKHDMVPEDELHKYNRAYRRNWKKRMKKK